jgi:hypothetical protein
MSPHASERETLRARILALIDACADGSRHDRQRDTLLQDLARYQAHTIPAYARFVAQRQVHGEATGLDQIPALPTDAFRFARMASHHERDDVRCFVSSGTTQAERSRHPFRDLTIYDRAAYAAARFALFPDRERMPLVIIAPSEQAQPSSSLSYMLARFVEWFGEASSVNVWREDMLDLHALSEVLTHAEMRKTPVAILGTSFAFVHAMDGLDGSRFELPRGSRIMQTGGFKGRSRVLEPNAMRSLLSECFGVEDAMIVAEYGMTELSSQLYETTLRASLLGQVPGPRRLWIPGWLRAAPVDPETLLARSDPQPGLLRVDDAANLDSVSCIQTADLSYCVQDGVIVTGRAEGAIARGCSISADDLLGRAHAKS